MSQATLGELIQPIRAVLFDLDGTILDSIEGILQSFYHAFATHLPEFKPSRRELIVKIGEPLTTQMQGFAGGHAELAARLVEAYRKHNREILPSLGLYEGAKETIGVLKARGFLTGLVTSKAHDSAGISLRAHGLEPYFDLIMAADDTPRHKPDPMPLLVAAERLAIKPSEMFYVGDSIHDIKCAHGAGATAVAALWGPFEEKMLIDLKPRYLLRSFRDLIDLQELSP